MLEDIGLAVLTEPRLGCDDWTCVLTVSTVCSISDLEADFTGWRDPQLMSVSDLVGLETSKSTPSSVSFSSITSFISPTKNGVLSEIVLHIGVLLSNSVALVTCFVT